MRMELIQPSSIYICSLVIKNSLSRTFSIHLFAFNFPFSSPSPTFLPTLSGFAQVVRNLSKAAQRKGMSKANMEESLFICSPLLCDRSMFSVIVRTQWNFLMLFLVKDLWCLATEWDGRRQKNKYTEYQISRQLSGYWDQPSNLSAQGSNFRASWKADWLLFILVGQGSAVSDPHGQEHVAKGPSRVSCPAETRRVRIESGGLQTCFFWGIFSLTMEVGHRGQVSTDLFSLIETPPPKPVFL